ncbi:NAD(P)-binding protein [Favolaschia claudopus]|uniref:NAD(P)-binding protein n=1 Tax=Favolaschia claudopus TaxID=2862362 RepID=A0AAW0BR96_9AGAR
MAPSVLVIGASGTVGRPLMQEFLAQKNDFNRVAVLADPAKTARFAEIQAQGIEAVVGSFLESSSYKGFDTVIALAGDSTLKLQPGMIDASIAGGVRHFYPSELTTDLSRGDIGKKRYYRDKIATREHLRQRAREVSGFKYTILTTGGFTEYVTIPFNNIDVEKHTASPYGYPDALTSLTAMPDIMRYLVKSILLPFDNPTQSSRILRVVGETLTFAQVLTTLEQVQGVNYDIKYLDPREAAENEEAARVAEDAEAEVYWSGKTLFATGVAYVPGPLDNARFDFVPETVRETMQRLFGFGKDHGE